MVSLRHLHPTDSSGEKPGGQSSAALAGGAPAARLGQSETSEGLASSVLSANSHPVNPPIPEPDQQATRSTAAAASAGAGDYGTFFRATLGPLCRYLSRLVGSREEAQDIAQDAYAKVFKVMQDKLVEHPQALLYTTARHLAIDELKHRGRSPFENGAAPDTPVLGAPGVEAIVMAREEAGLLEKAVAQLPGECRQVLLLRTGEHLTHEQNAQRTGLTRKLVEKRLYRAVALLHTAMQSRPASPTTP